MVVQIRHSQGGPSPIDLTEAIGYEEALSHGGASSNWEAVGTRGRLLSRSP